MNRLHSMRVHIALVTTDVKIGSCGAYIACQSRISEGETLPVLDTRRCNRYIKAVLCENRTEIYRYEMSYRF